MGKPNKPWLNYHKPNAPVREYSPKRKKPRLLIYARILLFSCFGLHRFYLRQIWQGFLILALFAIVRIIAISNSPQDQNEWTLLHYVLNILPLFFILLIEYLRLPKLVKKANAMTFGAENLNTVLLRGEIGIYGRLRPIVMFFIFSLAVYFLSVILKLPQPISIILVLMALLTVFYFFLRLEKIKKKV